MKTKTTWSTYSRERLAELETFTSEYRAFISENKTERECVASMVSLAREAGYRSLEELRETGTPLAPGDKVYRVNHGKTLMLMQLGTEPLERGLNILGGHIDSPRLDVKQNPLDVTKEQATLDLHYYGGVKKYQWLATPLAIHGVVVKTSGETVTVRIGEDPSDPVFCITDLLPHLASAQMEKKAKELIEGEKLDLLVGNRPAMASADGAEGASDTVLAVGEGGGKGDTPSPDDAVRANVLRLLAEQLGVEERDFLSAELEVVPAGPARDLGFDRSMILGYGQDDRVCSYPSLRAQLACEAPVRTSCTLLVDKEEIGSRGATSMASNFFEDTVAEVMELAGEGGFLALRRCLANSRMLSSDVSAGFDPKFADVFEESSACFLGHGVTINKYIGSGGKFGSNDADAEYVAEVMRALDDARVAYQTAELGKVDAGGGGTIAHILAVYGMRVIDCGLPVLSMHAPWEVVSKADVYEAYRGYRAFLGLA